MIVLTVNAGSSSIRLQVLQATGTGLQRLADLHYAQPEQPPEEVLRELLSRLDGKPVDVIAHRIVHGGERLLASCLIDEQVEREIGRLAPLAPLHNPAALAWLATCRSLLGSKVPHVAVFDTAFYAGLPEVARHYALPRELAARAGLRRFGFHGLAHQRLLQRWRQLQPGAPADARVISLQLGAGCSITASRGGAPLDTSMGFSPLEGLVMATRCGDLDAGLLLHMQRELAMGAGEIDRLLNGASGLLGVSGASADMRVLLQSGDAAARFAVELYCYRARKYVGAYLAVLGGIDAVLFGGGVGEHAPVVRERILDGLEWAGIALDPRANQAAIGAEARIDPVGTTAPQATVWVIPVDEAVVLAQQALQATGCVCPGSVDSDALRLTQQGATSMPAAAKPFATP